MTEQEELLAQMAEDAEAEEMALPSDAALARVSELAVKQAGLEKQVAEAERTLKDLQFKLARVTELELPEAMDAIGSAGFKLLDGSTVTVDTEYFANISADRKDAAFAWLRDTGNEDIIKNEVKGTFGKGEDEQAKALMDELDARGISYSNTESVHASTLKAFVKTQLLSEADLTPEDVEAGKLLPREVFGVHKKRVAKIKTVKGKR